MPAGFYFRSVIIPLKFTSDDYSQPNTLVLYTTKGSVFNESNKRLFEIWPRLWHGRFVL